VLSKPVCSIAIPVYKASPTTAETASLEQVASVLRDYPMTLVAPQSLSTDAYERVAPGLEVERFDDGFFADVAGYNRLMLDEGFYRRFRRRHYVLVYQLDAWVFRDELASWCARGHSYVGAPWFGENYLRFAGGRSRWMAASMVLRNRWRNVVGNGGFSLRRVEHCLAALDRERDAARDWNLNEDGFWAVHVMTRSLRFRVPHWREAARFSFELRPTQISAASGVTVPFGCHAWERYEPDYWRDLIPVTPSAA
jgi:hypothetical protein